MSIICDECVTNNQPLFCQFATHIGNHWNIATLWHNSLNMAGSLGSKKRRHAVTNHLGDGSCGQHGISSCVIPSECQSHIGQNVGIVVDLGWEEFNQIHSHMLSRMSHDSVPDILFKNYTQIPAVPPSVPTPSVPILGLSSHTEMQSISRWWSQLQPMERETFTLHSPHWNSLRNVDLFLDHHLKDNILIVVFIASNRIWRNWLFLNQAHVTLLNRLYIQFLFFRGGKCLLFFICSPLQWNICY